MIVRPVDFAVVQQMNEVSHIKQEENQRPVVEQQTITTQVQKETDTKAEQVQHKENADNHQKKYDAKDKSQNEYPDGHHQGKKGSKDGKFFIKGQEIVDIDIKILKRHGKEEHMVILEVILAVCGILCIAASFLLTEDEQKTSEQAKQPEKTVLSDGQKEEIRRQVNELVTEELNAINERTEASLDKISNTKILEMNDYADTVMGEINKSHNEAVFLYDMLNEKAKEVKNTVKDVNIAKHEVKKTAERYSS